MKCLVTGVSGFIGKRFASLCRERKMECVYLVPQSELGRVIEDDAVPGDITLPGEWRNALSGRGFDCLVHLAALIPNPDASPSLGDFHAVNAAGTLNLLEFAVGQKIPHFIYMSSLSVIGAPRMLPVTEEHPIAPGSGYAVSKACGELMCEEVNRSGACRVASLRLSAPYGPGFSRDTVLTIFLKRAMASRDITVFGTGRRTQNFIYIDDIASGIMNVIEGGASGICNLASDESVTMTRLAEMAIAACAGSKSNIVYAGEDPEENVRFEISIERLKTITSYMPAYPLERGLRLLAEHLGRPPEGC